MCPTVGLQLQSCLCPRPAAGPLPQAMQPPWAIAAQAPDKANNWSLGSLPDRRLRVKSNHSTDGSHESARWERLLTEDSVLGAQAQALGLGPWLPPAPSADPHRPGKHTAPAELSPEARKG